MSRRAKWMEDFTVIVGRMRANIATWNYRRCLQNAVRIHCYDTREVDIQSAVDVIPHDRGFLCRNHWIYTCSGAPRLLNGVSTFLLASFLAVVTYTTLVPRPL
ncbi:uncharacterized protein TNCV_832711 [Trichonephila clavipes]|nr:uncharacterized protein TNCV_832711 [Trichonephila clavipes]